MLQATTRGKQGASPTVSGESFTSGRTNSEIEEISDRTEKLQISKKRKRSPEPPNQGRLSLSNRRTTRSRLKPVKLAAKLHATTSKLRSKTAEMTNKQVAFRPMETRAKMKARKTPTKFSPKKGTLKCKIPTSTEKGGKAKYIGDNIRQLETRTATDLKRICRRTEVEYGNKLVAAVNIAEKLAQEAYGENDNDGEAENVTLKTGEEERKTMVEYGGNLEEMLCATVIMLTTEGWVRWLTKFVKTWESMYKDWGTTFLAKYTGIYVLASPKCRAQYIGRTGRDMGTRWREHTSATRRGEKTTHLYKWWRSFGAESYVILPVDAGAKEDLALLEQMYIKRWSPVLNTCGKIKGSARKRGNNRKGKWERNRDALHQPEGSTVRVVRFKCSKDDEWSVSALNLLKHLEKVGKRQFILHSTGGNSWADGWKKVKSMFGRSAVRCDGRDTTLTKCKSILDKGGSIDVRYLREWRPRIGTDKKTLIQLLRDPNKMHLIRATDEDVRFRWYKAAKDFQKKSIRSYLRRIIARVIKETSGWKMSADIVVKIKSPIPKGEKHVRFRLHELEDIHLMMLNARNIPKARHPDRVGLLKEEIEAVFQTWENQNPEDIVTVSWASAKKCMVGGTDEGDNFLDIAEVKQVKARLSKLVLCPLDRYQGETLVMCPLLYFEAMMEGFVTNSGYKVMSEHQEVSIMEDVRLAMKKEGIEQFAKLDMKGSFGEAYVHPKHKDLDRFRPICPSYADPATKTASCVAKALNHVLFNIPEKWHFNMCSVNEVPRQIERFNNANICKEEEDLLMEAMSYDIKDMFSKLPHADIMESVNWIIDMYRAKGKTWIRVNTRGKGCTFGITTGADHWRKMELEEIRNFVRVDLEHTAKRRQAHEVIRIKEEFEKCYPPNLTLKRTDNGSGTWDFLGMEMRLMKSYPYLGCVQMSKNEKAVWEGESLKFKNGQMFGSWGNKQQKGAVLASYLHRIDTNTTIRSEIPWRVFVLCQEMKKKDFPDTFVQRTLRRFSVGKVEIWQTTRKWICNEI
ncbi:hypothetical protein CBR_g12797 [Chara braunii]|uniref:GIY-YIG domain-containing protein n=1 Tax=Chara braunii TaxID=69332 RepID=A0A388KSN8_CHABU|nr:hypothetical protein CBR_g12797 [Chara braunii]|eukprot:GBG73081.1 hypothetical protein CBR_g12797 [Chara braunii]